MKTSRDLLILAAVISIFLHSVFLVSSRYLMLPGMKDLREESQSLFRIQRVEKMSNPVDLLGVKEEKPKALKMSQRVPKRDNKALEKMMVDDMSRDIFFSDKNNMLKQEMADEEIMDSKSDPDDELFEKESRRIKEEAAPEKRSILRTFMGKTINTVSASGADKDQSSMRHDASNQSFRWAVPTTGMMKMLKKGFGKGRGEGLFSKKAQIGDYEDISSVLGIKVYKYTDKTSGAKYFKIDISVSKNANLLVMPKEVIFLIDSSKSIKENKLEYIKAAVINSIWEMNTGDRFNIVAFRGDLVKYSDKSVWASTGSLLGAEIFTKKLKAVGQTDVDNALLGIVDTPAETIPSYIILVTDGRPTTGVVDSRRIIKQITLKNDLERPIFSFGGGERVNRYLLDFISYQNRGWSRFAGRTYQIEDEFKKLYEQIKDPLLLNVRYRLSNVDTEEAYPKHLSDLFRGRKMTVYGRYDHEDRFSMQLLGDVGGKTKELIFQESLDNAQPGDESIAKEWAFRKIYYLISQETKGEGDREDIRKEIDVLSKKYGIVTPYDIEDVD